MAKWFLAFLFFIPLSLLAVTKIVVIGDSISMGYVAKDLYGYVDRLQDRYIEEGQDIVLVNRSQGLAGSEILFQKGMDTIQMDHPDYILVLIGINDAGFCIPLEVLWSNFEKMFSYCAADCKRMIIGGVNCQMINPTYNIALATVYTSLVSSFNAFPVMLLGEDIHPYCEDKIHPNDTGHQMIADILYNVFHELGLY